MAVLWQSNEKPASEPVDAKWSSVGTPHQHGRMLGKNTFLEKHLRISNPLPSEIKMKEAVKEVHHDRNRGNNARVKSTRVHAVADTKKKQVYGQLRPGSVSTLFIGSTGFEQMNAYIEQHATVEGVHHLEIPLFGDAVAVTYTGSSDSYQLAKTGKVKLSVKVGAVADLIRGNGQSGSYQTKLVYHWEGVLP